MQALHARGRPIESPVPPRKAPRKIAPAKLEAKVRVEAAREKEVQRTKKQRAYSDAVIQHLESMDKTQRMRKAPPSALDPVMAEVTPMQEPKVNQQRKLD
jgi:hypothetical protein